MAKNHFKIDRGISLVPRAAAPSDPSNGDIYYDSTLGFQKYEAGSWGALGGTPSTGVTYSATAGEALGANVPVYISEGAADGSRTAGRIYKLDATNSFRNKYAGFTTASISSGVSGTVQIGGYLTGFTGLTAGQLSYASVTSPGALQSTEPNQLNHKKIELLVALSSTDAVIASNPNINYGSNKPEDGKVINYIINSNAEISTSGWATYADSAAASPVDGTGGSPTTTLTRSTSSPLRGSGSFLITKDAANRQGEGVSFDFTIDAADKGRVLALSFDFDAGTSVVGDSSDIRVWIYDVTNASLIQPTRYTIGSTVGPFNCIFPASNSTSYRLIFHIGTTNAAAWTFKFDNVQVSSQQKLFGMAGTDVVGYTPTYSGFGTVTASNVFYRRIGDCIQIFGHFTTGSLPGATFKVSLPAGLSADTSKMGTAVNLIGMWERDTTGTSGYTALLDPAEPTVIKVGNVGGGSPPTVPISGAGSSEKQSFCTIPFPVLGWTSNVTLSGASTFSIAGILANGTRVTATPTKFGEYRTYTKSINAISGSDNAPTTAPTTADGMLIYSVNYATAGTSGQTNRWEIFVGRNKSVFPQFYSSSGKTGDIDTKYDTANGLLTVNGLNFAYDPTTGIAVVDAMNQATTTSTRTVGSVIPAAGGAVTNPASCYFDIVVSDNALAVGVNAPRSFLRLHGGNGHGSTNTTIRRFTTIIEQYGSAFTYADSSTLGASVTINEDGLYFFSYHDTNNAGTDRSGLSKNSNQLTTNIASITAANFLSNDVDTDVQTTEILLPLKAGDVIRPHDAGSNSGTEMYKVHFMVTKVSD